MQELRDLDSASSGWPPGTRRPDLPKKARARPRARSAGHPAGPRHERLVRPGAGRADSRRRPAATADEKAMVRVLQARARPRGEDARAAGEGAGRGPVARRCRPGGEAREQKSFASSALRWSTLVGLRREQADAWGHSGERYDALLEGYEPGMKVARLAPVLTALKAKLVPLVRGDRRAPRRRRTCFAGQALRRRGAVALHLEAARGDGLRPRGRAGRTRAFTPSPAASTRRDVRLTTRINESDAAARHLRHHSRGRARALRAGLRAGARAHPARRRAVDGPARVAVAAVGEHRRAQPRLLGRTSSRALAGGVPRRSWATCRWTSSCAR